MLLSVSWFLAGGSARPAFAGAGDLDPTFGNGGKVTTNFGGDDARVSAVASQPDGKLVVAGSSGLGSVAVPSDFLVARFLANGTLDPSFGTGGKLTTDFGENEVARALALQPDGNIVVAGLGLGKLLLSRYLPDGRLDPTFGSGGKISTDLGPTTGIAQYGYVGALVLQPDGKLVASAAGGPGPTSDFVLLRYLPNGSLDPAFGSGGMVVTDFGGSDVPRALVLQPNGKAVVAGHTLPTENSRSFAVARYLPNGTLDPTFGDGGKVITAFGDYVEATGIVVQQDGKLVVAGYGAGAFSGVFLARYLPNGTLDPGFGNAGKVTTDFGPGSTANTLVLQPDGRLVVAGNSFHRSGPFPAQPRDFLLARYLPSGSLDPTFGPGGKIETAFGGLFHEASDLALQPDGKLVAVGRASPGENVALARYDTAGPAGQPIGGMGIGITPRSAIDLTWTAGEQQLGYYVARSPTAGATLPDRTTTYFTDKSPAYNGTLNCYSVFPLGQNGPLASSDVLCGLLGLRSQTGAPLDFTLRLNQSATASLSWSIAGWPSAHVLVAIPLDGSPLRFLDVPAPNTQVTDQTGGVFTCYQLYVNPSSGFTAWSDVACGLPGQSTFPSGSAARGTAALPQGRPFVAQGAGSPQVRAATTQGRLERLLQEGRETVRQRFERPRTNRPADMRQR